MEIVPRRGPSVSLVLDSSATLAFFYADETTEPIRKVFDAVVEAGAIVPHWRPEIANALTVASAPRAHRRQISTRSAWRPRLSRH